MSVREHYQVMRVSRLSPTFLVVGPGRMASGAVVAPEAARNRTRGERDRKAWSMLRDQPEEQMAAVCASATGFLSEGETTRREALVKPDRKSTRLNSSHGYISYAVFCLKKKKTSCWFSYTTQTGLNQSRYRHDDL